MAKQPIKRTDTWGEDADGNRGEEFIYYVCHECGSSINDDPNCEQCGYKFEEEE